MEGSRREDYDDDQDEPVNKKQKKDPFSIPPSACDAVVFQIQQPFVEMVFSLELGNTLEGDKVCDEGCMHDDALKAAIHHLSEQYLTASKGYKVETSELEYRDLHNALAKSFWWLTRPRKMQMHGERLQGIEEHIDLVVDPEEKEADKRHSDDSVDIIFEGDEGECQTTDIKQTKHDIKFVVYDERIKGIDKTILVLIVGCKWCSLSVEDVYQVASYACSLAPTNLQKGRFSPIHLEVWSERSWRYATLYPDGLVTIKDNAIKEVKYSRSRESYLMSLLEKRRNVCSTYSGLEYPEYPDGDYLEGLLFISNERFALPGGHSGRGSFMSPDSKLFYESKLRMIIGDKVLQWTSKDVIDAFKTRKEAVEQELAMLLDPS